MRSALSQYLADVHELLRDEQRHRGEQPGAYLEQDLQALARSRLLWTERRVRRAPYGGAYYSGLTPETDLFVYDGPQFLQIESKDLCAAIGRAIPTEFWARALDLHLGRACDTLADSPRDHYVVLVAAEGATDQIRAACLRWGICLVEPGRVPILVLGHMVEAADALLTRAGCAKADLQWACLPFNRRFPVEGRCVLLPFSRFRNNSVTDALLRFQRIATVGFRRMAIEEVFGQQCGRTTEIRISSLG